METMQRPSWPAKRGFVRAWHGALIAIAGASWCSTTALANANTNNNAELTRPDALLQIDMNRTAVVERIIASWGKELPAAQLESFKAKLMKLRADELLAANLSGSFDGVLEVIDAQEKVSARVLANAAMNPNSVAAISDLKLTSDRAKAIGELDKDLVYTPITPCRFLDTRGVFSPVFAGGEYAPSETRAYQATGNCGIPTGAQAVVTQIIMITPTAAGDIELLPQGATFGNTAAMVFQANVYSSVSLIARLNAANGQFSTQIRGPGGHVAMDVTGYFMPPTRNGDGLRVITGLAASAGTPSGTLAVNMIGGSSANVVSPGAVGATIAGGGANTSGRQNQVTGNYGTVSGGFSNSAAAFSAVVGGQANSANAQNAFVGGGLLNVVAVSGGQSAIAGGQQNTINASYGSIGGGLSNQVSGDGGTVSGGKGNQATGLSSSVGGGGYGTNSNCYDHVTQTNVAPCWNVASGQTSTVVGGSNNRAEGVASSVGGGEQNRATGNSSVIAGGIANRSTGIEGFVGSGYANSVTGQRATIVGGSGGLNAGYASFMGVGGQRTTSDCYNHATSTSTTPVNDRPCWNEISANAGSSVLGGGYNNRMDNPFAVLVGGASNTVSQNDAALVGGWSNTINDQGFNGFVGAGNRNTVSAAGAAITAGQLNTIPNTGGRAFIGGGDSNSASGFATVVGGGQGNQATGDRAVIAGGGSTGTTQCFNHTTGTNGVDGTCVNRAQGRRNFIGAGVGAETSANESVVVGGYSNRATANGAFVGAGFVNTASGVGSAVVAGGGTSPVCFNRATQANDGTCTNTASGESSFIGSGPGQLASGRFATIGGGVNNHATGERSTIAGGNTSTASGLSSTVPGGRGNWAAGAYSFAAGRTAYATSATNSADTTGTPFFGAFVWSDTPDDGSGATPAASQPFRATANNQFAVRSRGGVVFNVDNVNIASNAAQVSGKCELPAGGAPTWSCTSDRNTKEAFTKISPRDVLNKVISMPMMTWQYKGVNRKHLSPMAQDFWAAFGLGVDDKQITSSDVSGVALAAIQGVNQKLNSEVANLKEKNAKLERELAAIKKKLGL